MIRLHIFLREIFWSFSHCGSVDQNVVRLCFTVAWNNFLSREFEEVESKRKELILIEIDKYLSGKYTSQEFIRSLFRYYLRATRRPMFFDLNKFLERIGGNRVKVIKLE